MQSESAEPSPIGQKTRWKKMIRLFQKGKWLAGKWRNCCLLATGLRCFRHVSSTLSLRLVVARRFPDLCQIARAIDHTHDLSAVAFKPVKQKPAFSHQTSGVGRDVWSCDARFWEGGEPAPRLSIRAIILSAVFTPLSLAIHNQIRANPVGRVKSENGQSPRSGFRLAQTLTPFALEVFEIEFLCITTGKALAPGLTEPKEVYAALPGRCFSSRRNASRTTSLEDV